MNLNKFDQLSQDEARKLLMLCCTSTAWVNNMLNARSFGSELRLIEAANVSWRELDESDYLEAFAGHPKIGDVNSLRVKYANTKALASGEQSLLNDASEQVLTDLSNDNDAYYARFGFIFIVCATGKNAEEMLMILRARLANNRGAELINAIEEQRKIFQLRLINAFGE